MSDLAAGEDDEPDDVEEYFPPEDGLWRIGPSGDPFRTRPPLTPSELNTSTAGNRFDDPTGTYRVLYLASTLEGAFGETLENFRVDPLVAPEVLEDWSELGFMAPGAIAAEWREQRLAVRAELGPGHFRDAPFLDVESPITRRTLSYEVGAGLAALGVKDLDVATIRGGDRRVTRLISYWAYEQVNLDDEPYYAGIRFLSRHNTEWECWAIFEDVALRALERRQITRQMPELGTICEMWTLRVF